MFVVEKHPNRWSIGIIKLTSTSSPDESRQKQASHRHTHTYQHIHYAHGFLLFGYKKASKATKKT
jgi:hypothetical protein